MGINIDNLLFARKCKTFVYVIAFYFHINTLRYAYTIHATDLKTDEAVRFILAQSFTCSRWEATLHSQICILLWLTYKRVRNPIIYAFLLPNSMPLCFNWRYFFEPFKALSIRLGSFYEFSRN